MDKLKLLIKNYSECYTQMLTCFNALKSVATDEEKVDWLDVFYTEGWDNNYSEDGSFYILGDRNKEIEELLSTHKDEASEERKRYNEIKLKIWKLLPDFYHYHISPFKYYEPPETYDPDKPFEA